MDLCENSEVEKERRNTEYNNTLVIIWYAILLIAKKKFEIRKAETLANDT